MQAGRHPGRFTSFMISLSWKEEPLPPVIRVLDYLAALFQLQNFHLCAVHSC